RPDDALGPLRLGAETDDHVSAGVLPRVALDDASDDVALPRRELAVHPLVLGVTEALQHDLAGGGRRDTAETLWGVVPFADQVATLVGLPGKHLDNATLAVDVDAGLGFMALRMPVRGQQCGLDGLEQLVDRDPP